MNLVIGWDSYSWVKHISGLVSRSPKDYELLIITKDWEDQLLFCTSDLCQEAIYAQRKNDIFRIAKRIRLKKVSNLGYTYVEIERLIAQIQLKCLFHKYNKIFYQNTLILSGIIPNIASSSSIKCYSFGKIIKESVNKKVVNLTDNEVERKLGLAKMIAGAKSYDDLRLYPVAETFFRSV